MPTETLVQSPCVRNCTLDENDVCLGCGRTLAEITEWLHMDAVSRQAVLDRLAHSSTKQ